MRISLIFGSTIVKSNVLFNRSRLLITSRNMASAYLRFEEGSERFQFSFNFQHKNVNRQFNFSRQASETVQDFLTRVSTNVGKVVDPKKKKKKKAIEKECNDEVENVDQIDVQLLKDGVAVSPESKCQEILCQDGLTLRVCENLYDVEVNAPWVSSIVLPDSMLAGFPVYPSKLDMEFANRDDSLFEWFISPNDKRDNFEWVKVGDGFFYTPLTSDIGSRLQVRCIPRRKIIGGDMMKGGPLVEAISPTVVEAGPGKCPFETRHGFTPKRISGSRFRVVSYNLLADTYVDSDYSRTVLFPYCPPYALAINYRKQLFLKELIGYNADLICLQEVDAKVFEFDLTPVLSSVGFGGVFQRKGEGKVNEGLACFFHKSKFKFIQTSSLALGKEFPTNPVFSKMYKELKETSLGQLMIAQMADLPTTVQATVLEVIDDGPMKGRRLVIGATHLYFHPLADNIRMLQTAMALTYLENMVEEASLATSQRAALVFCGDFNSTPDTGAHRLLLCGKVDADDPTWASGKMEEGGQSPEEPLNVQMSLNEIDMRGIELSHAFPLESAYHGLDFTNYTAGFVGCLDYIFYTKNDFAMEQVVPLPVEEEVTQNTALPSIVFPSDHIALIADLRWQTS